MTKIAPLAAIALVLTLAACEQKTETVTSEAPDPQAEQLKKAPPAVLPPSMRASKTFRCKDNSLVHVDFFNGDKLAHLKPTENGPTINLTAEKAGDPMVADGYSMTGTPEAITLTQPGKGTLTCKS